MVPHGTETVFNLTTEFAKAGYAITNFRFTNQLDNQDLFEAISNQYELTFCIRVDGVAILSILKLR